MKKTDSGIFCRYMSAKRRTGANLKAYEAYIWDWHQFLALCRRESAQLEEAQIKILQTYLLRTFYQTPYGSEDFYKTFYERMAAVKETLG